MFHRMMRSLLGVLAFVLLVQHFGEEVKATTIYNVVNDFSLSSNPNGQWSYMQDTGSGPQSLTYSSSNLPVLGGLNVWWSDQAVPNSVVVCQNRVGATLIIESMVYPPNLLLLDPESDTVIVRWTAPESGTWDVSGLFQGIDVNEQPHSVEILKNYDTLVLAPTTMSEYGQVVPFNQPVSLVAGDTIDFVVGDYTVTYGDLATGLSATISPTPEPSTVALLAVGAVGMFGWMWRRRRFAKRAAASDENAAPPIFLLFPSNSVRTREIRRAA